MKKLKQILVVILALTTFISCDKEDNSPDAIKQETISAKWIVDGTSEFKSFEFNKNGNYIIVKKGSSVTGKSTVDGGEVVLFGTYEILDSETLLLSNFGTIKITSINKDTMDYTITLEDSEKSVYTISVAKADELASSIKTEMLCRTWKLVETNGYEHDAADGIELLLFSKAGTYFTSLLMSQDDPDSEIAKWKWKDETETKVYYSWKETPEWNLDNDDEGEVEIVELTENRLEIFEIYDNEEYIYVYEPYVAAKTTKKIAVKNTLKTTVKRGFLGR